MYFVKSAKESRMLKKLVKYGNSNALVLDKAILELLNIAEGSVLKISTDGKLLILTPQKNSEPQQIHETYDSNQALLAVLSLETLKRYNISEESKKELMDLYKKLNDLNLELIQNPDFIDGRAQLLKQFSDTASLEYIKASNALRARVLPEIVAIEQKLMNFESDHKLTVNQDFNSVILNEDAKIKMKQEFAIVFKNHSHAFVLFNALLNNPDYQHEVQLIVEKFEDNQNSLQYIEAIEAIQRKFSPETQQLRNELKAIGQKYSPVVSK
jgi:antitoxin component of MazEF toxin-antitoxin module